MTDREMLDDVSAKLSAIGERLDAIEAKSNEGAVTHAEVVSVAEAIEKVSVRVTELENRYCASEDVPATFTAVEVAPEVEESNVVNFSIDDSADAPAPSHVIS
jgi:hypothetical protein